MNTPASSRARRLSCSEPLSRALRAAAISFARLRRVYFGAYDPKGGGVEHGPRFFQQPTCHHAPEVYAGIAEVESAELLKSFFAQKR